MSSHTAIHLYPLGLICFGLPLSLFFLYPFIDDGELDNLLLAHCPWSFPRSYAFFNPWGKWSLNNREEHTDQEQA